MLGLTGGIGAGKSTVAAMLAERGAVVIDTDEVARDVVEPGGLAYDQVVRRFGREVLDEHGRIDRSRLAEAAFADDRARADLNAVVHPAVESVVEQRLRELDRPGRVVVLQVPLLVEAGWHRLVDRIVVVDCPEEVAVRRLVDLRGMDEGDARRRIAAQANREDRLAAADMVIPNDGTVEDLRTRVAQAWDSLRPPDPHPEVTPSP
ncbi:MAG: dephospho-CoA kinase [Acidimicrobiia bacterium]